MPVTRKPREPVWIIGWREWLALPDLNVTRIKAKVDTGARSSALHAFDIEPFDRDGTRMVRFRIHPRQEDSRAVVTAEAELLDMRSVRSSSGQQEIRPVIQTTACVLNRRWPIELTLTKRDQMGFRMLLGRQALRRRFLVDTGRSFLTGSLGPDDTA
jgi:hypothetical protein